MHNIKEAFPVEDGAIHGPNGRYFLPIVTTGEGKKLSISGAIVLTVCAVIVVVICLLGSNWLSEDYSELLTNYDNYIGYTKQEVMQVLKLSESDMQEVSDGSYLVTEKIKLYNEEFDLVLFFDEADLTLCGYGYQTRFQAEPETAAKHVSEFVNKLGYKKTDGELFTLEEADLTNSFTDKDEFHLNQSWDLTPGEHAAGTIAEYLTKLENNEDWPGRFSGLLAIPAAWYRDMDISYDPHDQILSIQLKYGAEARRTGVLAEQ